MNNKKIPVILITGYLGSGKTTLLSFLRKYARSTGKSSWSWWTNIQGSLSVQRVTSGKLSDDITQKEEINMSDVKTECGIPGHCSCDGKDHSSCNVCGEPMCSGKTHDHK